VLSSTTRTVFLVAPEGWLCTMFNSLHVPSREGKCPIADYR
jgi:hypothetical protein